MLFNYEKNFIFWQLLLYGVHIGHRFRNSSLYAGWLIFTYTYETLIINLYKTILGFKNGNLGYDYCCRVGSPIWFLNLNKAFDIYVNESALKCGEFAYTTYWIHGMISNWVFLADQINKLWHYTEDAHKGQFAKLEMDYSPWFLSRWSWPRALLISSVHTSEWPSHECLLARIPSVGIVDTNISGHISNIATPGNDDSLDAMVYYNTNTSQYILEKKYMHVVVWLHHIREWKRNINFGEWVLRNFIKKNGHTNFEKVSKIIKRREKEAKITDRMQFLMAFKVNIVHYWGLGVKFFFGLDSGREEFQGGLDLYSQNGEKINNKFDIYSLMEKFKRRGFFLCKMQNYYLLKSLWHSSSSALVRRKFMGQKWFKYRFLTNNYYAKVFFDDYFRTNFLVNRFWRNRIFKTYLRRSFFRNNIFLLKFFKFYNVYRYNEKRGFLDMFSANLTKVSAFSHVAYSYGFNYFKKHFYTPLLDPNNGFTNLFNNKKRVFFSRWLFFKREIGSIVNRIVYSSKFSKNYKFMTMFKIYSLLRKKFQSYVYFIYANLNFYFSFWYWNRDLYRFIKKTRRTHLVKKFRALKKLGRWFDSIDLFNSCAFPLKRFRCWFLKNSIDHRNEELLSINFSKIFGLLGLNARNSYFQKNLLYKNSKMLRIERSFLKLAKNNRYRKRDNKVIYLLKYKYKKFKKTPEVQKAVRKMYQKYPKNALVSSFNKRYGVKWSRRITRAKFFSLAEKIKNKDQLLKRFLKFSTAKFNAPSFNFFQITKNLYNKKVFNEWTPAFVNEKDILWDLNDDDEKKVPSMFLEIFPLTKSPTTKNQDLHDYSYFTKALRRTTFDKLFTLFFQLKHQTMMSVLKKIVENNLPLQKHINSFIYYHWEKLRKVKARYKNYMSRYGKKAYRLVAGSKFFYFSYFFRLWSLVKKNYFLADGFSFKNWHLLLNVNYPRRKKDLTIPLYEEKNGQTLVTNYSYFFYVRFFSIYQKYFSMIQRKNLSHQSPMLLRKTKMSYYLKKNKKIYWS